MNKTAIKNFAIWARVQLIESAKQRAYEYEITEDGENKTNVDVIGGRLLSNDEKDQRKQLIAQIHQKGYTQVMEEAAYTWFNRFIALRFMEVNGYLPSKTRVFTDETGAFKPGYIGQLHTYMRVLDDKVRKPHENPTIGILLCKSADKAFVEYVISDYNSPMGVATYKTADDMDERMRKSLPDLEEMRKLLSDNSL